MDTSIRTAVGRAPGIVPVSRPHRASFEDVMHQGTRHRVAFVPTITLGEHIPEDVGG